MSQDEMDLICNALSTKSDKIRALHEAGATKADIGRYLGVRYQFVYNVIKAATSDVPRPAAQHPAGSSPRSDGEGGSLTIPEAKRRLAETLGVPESAIKITVEH